MPIVIPPPPPRSDPQDFVDGAKMVAFFLAIDESGNHLWVIGESAMGEKLSKREEVIFH